MKYKPMNSTVKLLAILAVAGIWFIACSEDEGPAEPKTLEYYKAWLTEIVQSELAVVQNCVVGYNKGDFNSEEFYEEYTSAYLSALLDADSVLARPDVTIAMIMDANYFISAPGKKFNDRVFISDRRPVHELVVYCDTLRVHTPVGMDPGQAPQDAHDRFGGAISYARGVRDRSSTIERQVTEAVDSLNLELAVFEDAIIK